MHLSCGRFKRIDGEDAGAHKEMFMWTVKR